VDIGSWSKHYKEYLITVIDVIGGHAHKACSSIL